MIQKTFFFLSSPLKPKRSSTILLFLSFSRESSMSECVKKNRRVFLCWVGRLTIACRVDYLHKGVLDNDGWNGHHDQAHIFLEKRIVIFFFILVFLSSRFKCRLLHFSLQLYSFLHRLILKSAFVEKKCRKCSSPTSKVDCHKMMLMIRRASRDPGRDFTMNGNAIFSDLLLSSKSQRPRDKKQHCHLRFADVLLLKKDSEESIASIFIKKKWYFRHEWISSQDVFESMLRFHCKNWSCDLLLPKLAFIS